MRLTPNPEIIAWAIERCGKTPKDLKNAFPRIQEWIEGKGKPPTAKQVEKLAKRTHVLPSYFYKEEIPDLSLQIPDFRTMDSKAPVNPSPELYDVINQMLSRQDWLSGYLEEMGAEPIEFIGCCSEAKCIGDCAAKMWDLLDLKPGWARGKQGSAAVKFLRDHIEALGVYVYAGSYFGNVTTRPFDEKEFRGFVLTDSYAPVIFLNTRDAYSAQLFTLAHEFAHILFNESGVDDAMLGRENKGKEDRCNALAAEFLVPASLLHPAFDEHDINSALKELEKLTGASTIVVLRRAKDLGRITQKEFFDRYDAYMEELPERLERKEARNSGTGAPSPYVLKKNHLGSLFTETIFTALKSEYLLYSDAYRLTGMKANFFNEYYRREGMYV